jgi:DNA-nicking Smr family endonuclease
MPNKYEQIPEVEIDLHGCTTEESKQLLDSVIDEGRHRFIRVIVGKGRNSDNGPILPNYVKGYLNERGLRYNLAKQRDGGEGALEVFLR